MAAGERIFRHILRRVVRPFLTKAEKARVAAAIREAESRTTGEIVVRVVGRLKGEPLEAARREFHRLGLEKTHERNAVLVLISHLDRRFAIWGDSGIHDAAGQDLWEHSARALRERLAQGRHAEAVEECVRRVGEELARRFPRDPREPRVDQLPDDVR